jgi:isopentenyl-diphosphate Delta-isomerase
MVYPPVIVVDEHDHQIGLAMLAEVWSQGLYHRTVRIMAEDSQGRVLLQKRSDNMVIFPGCWDNSAAGHVDEGMTYHDAALQEVAEELGVSCEGLAEMGHYLSRDVYQGKIMNQFSKVYRLRFTGIPNTDDEHEVADFAWVTVEDAKKMAREHPEQMTFGLYHVLTKFY